MVRAARGGLWLGGTCLFACSVLACSAIFGFEDRSLDPALANGGDGAGHDAMFETGTGPTTDAPIDSPIGPLVAPTNVVAAVVDAVGDVKTLAGSGTPEFRDGQGVAASFKHPYGLVVEPGGNIYVADPGNERIRKISPSGMVTTIAGTGVDGWFDSPTGSLAKFFTPGGLSLDPTGNIYAPEFNNHRLRMITPAGAVTTLAGNGTATWADGTGDVASFNQPISSATDMNGNIYIADFGNNRVRKVSPTGDVSTLAGSGTAAFADGTGDLASFSTPAGVAVTPNGDAIYIADNGNNRIRKVTQAGVVTTAAGSGVPSFADGKGVLAILDNPTGIALHPTTGDLYIGDSGNSQIRRMTPDGTVSTIAGQLLPGFADAKGKLAKFDGIQGLAVDSVGAVYVADYNNHRIRKVTITGIGWLDVTWSAPATTGGSSIKSYTATAAAAGQPTKTCTSTNLLQCTIVGLTSYVPYSVTVTATNNASKTSAPSKAIIQSPN